MLAKANKNIKAKYNYALERKMIMKLTNSQEEYLKTIYLLEKNQQKVRVTDIAQKMNITKPSVNKALRILKDLKLINYEVYGNIELTNEGGKNAKEIIKKQDTLEIFLIGILGIDKNQAEEEAKAIKHAMSKESIEKLDNYITKILDLGDLKCGYDKNNEKCRSCIKITARERLKEAKGL